MNTKISEAAVEAALDVYYSGNPGHGPRALKNVVRRALTAALPHLHPQPAELAEQQGVREQFEVWASGDGFDVTKVKGIYSDPLARGAWDAWRYLAATGKQQVVEVQGDALVTAEMVEAAENSRVAYLNAAAQYGSMGVDERHSRAMRAALRTALAARQPGAQAPNFAACCAEGGGSISGCSCVNPNHVLLAWQASFSAEERAHEETIDQRDRYHEVADELAGHIERITGTELGEHSSVNCPWQNAIEAAEGYTHAQGIDLGQFRAAVAMYEWAHRGLATHSEKLRAEHQDAVRLLALIDQRDAAPGVERGPTCKESLQVASCRKENSNG